MTKKELAACVAAKANVSKKDAMACVNAVFDTIKDTIKEEPVQIIGFGTFYVSERPEKIMRNPASGQLVEVKARKLPKFKIGKALKAAVK